MILIPVLAGHMQSLQHHKRPIEARPKTHARPVKSKAARRRGRA